MLERNLVTSLLLYESIRTTKKRAKVIQPAVDKLIHYAKSHPPHVAIRYANRVVTDKNASRKIMEVYCKRYADRTSGLSRITPVGARKGDGAELVDLELIDAEVGSSFDAKKAAGPSTELRTGGKRQAGSTDDEQPSAARSSLTAKKKSKVDKKATKKPSSKKKES
tara:strand:- start:205 stop:702 length:498 start_codon:yes stop_codon:yes gene_type:complete